MAIKAFINQTFFVTIKPEDRNLSDYLLVYWSETCFFFSGSATKEETRFQKAIPTIHKEFSEIVSSGFTSFLH